MLLLILCPLLVWCFQAVFKLCSVTMVTCYVYVQHLVVLVFSGFQESCFDVMHYHSSFLHVHVTSLIGQTKESWCSMVLPSISVWVLYFVSTLFLWQMHFLVTFIMFIVTFVLSPAKFVKLDIHPKSNQSSEIGLIFTITC